MPAPILHYFLLYGYLAIFAVVLLQELGMPGLPNELVLFYFGYLAWKSGFSYPVVILLVVLADILGSVILFLLFYHCREWLVLIKPKWLKLPEKKILTLSEKIALQGGRYIFVAKLTPFVRSYIPVVAGLVQLNPMQYARIIFLTAFIWSGGWVTAGWLLHW